MGMAASQARYLELTARKTNVEFQGQQINQQRTDLANQTAGLFAQLMGLQVPTPPSSADFTTTNYTFSDGTNKYTITGLQSRPSDQNYNYDVTYYHTESVYTGVAQTRSDFGAKWVGANPGGTYVLTDLKGEEAHRLTQCSTGNNDDTTALDQIVKDTGSSSHLATDYAAGITNIYKYTAINGTTYYYSSYDLEHMPAGGAVGPLTGYYAANIDKKIPNTEPAWVTKADSGRLATIRLQSEGNLELNLTAENVTDQNAFQDAMNEYTYKQQRYQQEVNNINARTSIVQAQDKTLELQLKQLDTEQEALSTELDSVKKVIDKNIEQTFKTFQ